MESLIGVKLNTVTTRSKRAYFFHLYLVYRAFEINLLGCILFFVLRFDRCE